MSVMSDEDFEKFLSQGALPAYVIIPQNLIPLVKEVGWLSMKEEARKEMDQFPIRCGCILHLKSPNVTGCPVLQVERMTKKVSENHILYENRISDIKELEKQVEVLQLAVYETAVVLLDVLPDSYFPEEEE